MGTTAAPSQTRTPSRQASARPSGLAPVHRRALKHPRLAQYHRLTLAVLLANLAVLAHSLHRGSWRLEDGSALSGTSALVLVNFAAAVLIRSQHVVNALFRLAGRGPRSWPLWLRWAISKIYHVGGIHVGAAIAGTAWLAGFAATATAAHRRGLHVSAPVLATAHVLVALTVLIVVCALPPTRRRAHDLFEASHRFGGWAAVALFWVLAVALELDHRGAEPPLEALASSWRIWLLVLVTASVVLPWVRLRRVPVSVQRLSSHAAVATFDHTTPPLGANLGISRSPLWQWHSFATVRTPGRSGFRLLISRAGDWTGRFIDDPPRHVWVRGTPVASLARVEPLYERIVYVVTGSGLGPCFGQILGSPVPIRLVWSVRSPRATYGDALVDEVEAAQPDAVIWDTTTRGKPNLLRLTVGACRDFGADAVFVVSNEPTTRRLVHGLERLGIPAFGPIFDS
ncbi:hypothetical protein [Quadrisphaera sp. DSM 44207]|uniref:hypothetical protein n=1 Tax=Quadrisphaera sp. DSM 44207 TaxID=1881057 RepID=UPI000881FEC6|nr:hypothetical protein [Quadrisphaera sp. DSM 44207]SDQ07074.1 hypothetical protein SAMN05428996_0344 [Quadrisphaera sp. DSM 44207]